MPILNHYYMTNDSDIFKMYVYIPCGSIYENKKNSGCSHLLEHMVFRNHGKISKDITNSLSQLGAEYNAMTQKDLTCYYSTSHVDTYKKILPIFQQLLIKPTFTEKDLETERKVVLEEYAQTMDDEAMFLEELTFDCIFNEKNVYKKSIIGSKSVLQNITHKELKEYFETYYKNMLIVINCPKKVLSNVKEEVQKYFGKPKMVDFMDKKIQETIVTDPKVYTVYRPMEQYLTRIVYPIPNNITDKELVIMDFISYTLAEMGISGLLNQEIRKKRGLVYTVQTQFEMLQYVGIFLIQFASSNSKIEYILSIALSVIHQLTRTGLSEKKMKYYKNGFLNNTKIAMNDVDRISQWHGLMYFYGHDIPNKKYLEIASHLTNQDVIHFSRKIFDFDKQGIITIGAYSNTNRVTNSIINLLASYRSIDGGQGGILNGLSN